MSSGPTEFEFEPESQETENHEFSEPQLPAGDEPTNEPTPTENQSSTTEQDKEEVKDNPAWNDILNPVPEHFHPHLKSHLSRMEKYAQEQQQIAAQYKEFTDNKISREQLVQGLQFMTLLQTNPRGVYDYLQQQYNYQAQQQAANSQEQQREENQSSGTNLELGEEQPDIFKDPRVQQLQNQATFAAQAVQQMQEQAIQAQMAAQVDTEVAAVQNHAQYKSLPMDLVIRTALGMAAEQQARTGKEVPADVMAAAKSLWDTGAFAPKSRVTPPPNLSRARSGVPADSEPEFGKMTRQQRTAYVASMMRQHENE